MNDPNAHDDAFYICAGICRVNLKTNCCMGCGRPWDWPEASETESAPASGQDAGLADDSAASMDRVASVSA